jgi:hypothetical protein
MAALRYIYEALSMQYRMDANAAYENIANYWVTQDALKAISSLRGSEGGSVGEGAGERTVYQTIGPNGRSINAVANDVLRTSRAQQRQFARARAQSMPRQYSAVATSESPLPVAYRTARFLGPEGETRTEVFWGGNVVQQDGPRHQAVTVSLVEYLPRYRKGKTKSKRYLFKNRRDTSTFRVAPERIEVASLSDPYHLAVQWDRFTASGTEAAIEFGDHTGRQTVRIDSLRALSADPSRLEMSDLRPMVPSGQRFDATDPTETARPYPFSFLSADTPLLLYFEVYHLAYTDQNRTQYEVAYEVTRTMKGDGFLGMFGGTDKERTETASTYTSRQRRTSEAILVDWNKEADPATAVTITVRVTDKTTGQAVERSIGFQMASQKER